MDSAERPVEIVVVDSDVVVAVGIVSRDDPEVILSASSVGGFGTGVGGTTESFFVSGVGVTGSFCLSFFLSFFISVMFDSADSGLGFSFLGDSGTLGPEGGGDSFFSSDSVTSSLTRFLVSAAGSILLFFRPRLPITLTGISIAVSPELSLSVSSKSIFGISRTTSLVSIPLTAGMVGADFVGLLSAALVFPLGPLLRGRFGVVSGDLSNSGDGMSYGTMIPSLL